MSTFNRTWRVGRYTVVLNAPRSKAGADLAAEFGIDAVVDL